MQHGQTLARHKICSEEEFSINISLSSGDDVTDSEGEKDPLLARNWPASKKWALIATLSFITLLNALASSMFAPAVPQLMAEFGADDLVLASLVVSIYVLGTGAGPLLFAPLSELFGRAPLYHSTNLLFVLLTLACGFAPSFPALIALRLLQGISGSATATLGGGTVGDLFVPEQRGRAIAAWSMCALLGPTIGPVAGAALAAAAGWRWVFWLLAIAAGTTGVVFLWTGPETYEPALRARAAGGPLGKRRVHGGRSGAATVRQTVVRPLKMLLFYPIVTIMATLTAIVYGYLYLLYTSITIVFEEAYGFAPNVVGLTFLGIGIGMIAGVAAFGILSDRKIQKARKQGQDAPPEYRLDIMIPGGLMISGGLFLYGWTAELRVFWLAPIAGTALAGAGIMTFWAPSQAYLVDAFELHSASAIAACTVWRSILGAVLPIAGLPMYRRLGLGWGNSILGFIALALVPVAFLVRRYGGRLRERSRFAIQ